MRPDSISQPFERACMAAGIGGLTFHDLSVRLPARSSIRFMCPAPLRRRTKQCEPDQSAEIY